MVRDTGRIIDANLNRVTEGLRVIEDVVRYGRDDAVIQQRLKTLRHRIASGLDSGEFILSRDSLSDVGFRSVSALEGRRGSLGDIVRSNMKRVQEGLRVLEEVLKIDSPSLSGVMKEVRYECYQIERDIELHNRKTLRKGLYLILTDPAKGYERMTEMAVSEGLPAVQLRAKGLDDREVLRIAKAMQEITKGSGTRLIVNDRVDIALMASADGVHLGQGDAPAEEARRLAGEGLIIGLSTHTLEQVDAAQSKPVDYIGFGPVYPPFSKQDHERVTGVARLREAVERSRLPVAAIGGISRDRLAELAGIPIQNVACIGAVESAPDPALEMRAIQEETGEKP